MTACKRSESSESDLQDYLINGCSSAISLKRELSSYALHTINDWGDSVARQLLTSNSLVNELQCDSKLKQSANEAKKTSWKTSLELACSLDEMDDSLTNCLSVIASRMIFAKDDDEELFEYKNERSITSIQSESMSLSDDSLLAPTSSIAFDHGIVKDIQNLTLASNTTNTRNPSPNDKRPTTNPSYK